MANDVSPMELVAVKNEKLYSALLQREVLIDIYFPPPQTNLSNVSLLLINDGQDLPLMPFADILSGLYQSNAMEPVLCVGIHCGTDRKNEYGTANHLHYKGFGAKAAGYTQFILQELLPFINRISGISSFRDKSFAGFSLGGLSALDIVINHPNHFINAGIFSGSLWWRSRGYGRSYNDNTDRIMHAQVRKLPLCPALSFFFECGALDELADRNNNGVIDSIEDTLDLIKELRSKGYSEESIKCVEVPDGMHNVATWARIFPEYLTWKWGNIK